MKKIALVLALSLTPALSHATVTIFSDNFDSDALGLNQTTFNGGWTVSGGTVDLIGNSNFFDFLSGNGRYVDLDGSTNQAGEFHKDLVLTAGVEYTLSFDLAGSHRGSTENVNISLGGFNSNLSVSSSTPFTTNTLLFTPGVTGSYSLIFQNSGSDNIGALLDNVSVTAVPEPETYAMLLAGLGLLGFAACRKK